MYNELMTPSICVIILARNVAQEIVPALKTAKHLTKDILIVDTGSTDSTISVSRPYTKKVVYTSGNDFAAWRNLGAKHATADWLLYLDSDERLTPELVKEINTTLENPRFSAYTIPRYEVLLGSHLSHWGDSRVIRLIRRDALSRWVGKLHEQPKIDGTIGQLHYHLVHLTHKNFHEKLSGTLNWSLMEAELLFAANHPPVIWWRFWRIMLTEFWDRCVRRRLFLDGTEGWLEIIYQMFSRYLAYARLWELQRQPTLEKTYQDIDKKLLARFK